jgi:hypothetical protein
MTQYYRRLLNSVSIVILFFAGCGGAALSEDAETDELEHQDGGSDAADVRQDDLADGDPAEAPEMIQDFSQEVSDIPGEEPAEDVQAEDAPPGCSDMEGEIQNPDIWILQSGIGVHATFGLIITNPNPAAGACAFSGITIDQVTVNRGSDGSEITTLSEITPSGAPLAAVLAPGGSSAASYEAVDPYMSPVTFCGTSGLVKVGIGYIGDGGIRKTLSLNSTNVTIRCE